MGSIGMGAVSCKGHPSFVQRASKFRAKGIFTSGYALCMCKLLHRSVRRHGGTSSARRRSFIRGVEKFRISSPALQLHKKDLFCETKELQERRWRNSTFLHRQRKEALHVWRLSIGVWIIQESSLLILSHGIFAASERACMNSNGGSSPSSTKMQYSA